MNSSNRFFYSSAGSGTVLIFPLSYTHTLSLSLTYMCVCVCIYLHALHALSCPSDLESLGLDTAKLWKYKQTHFFSRRAGLQQDHKHYTRHHGRYICIYVHTHTQHVCRYVCMYARCMYIIYRHHGRRQGRQHAEDSCARAPLARRGGAWTTTSPKGLSFS